MEDFLNALLLRMGLPTLSDIRKIKESRKWVEKERVRRAKVLTPAEQLKQIDRMSEEIGRN